MLLGAELSQRSRSHGRTSIALARAFAGASRRPSRRRRRWPARSCSASDLGPEDDEAFRRAASPHLLAVNGTHLVFAVVALVRAFGFYWRASNLWRRAGTSDG
jgi:hypothetical protein